MNLLRARADILVVGQGLAGTCLAWTLERAGLAFELADRGHGYASTMAAAGIINPITGRRLVKSWRVEELMPESRAFFRDVESALGVSLWREMRVRRLFADDRERRVWSDKQGRRELAPFAGAGDDEGFWIEGAARVDLPALLTAARGYWQRAGRLRETPVGVLACEADRYAMVVDCSGLAAARSGAFAFVPWEFSKGEMLELTVEGLAPDVIVNRRHWVLPVGPGAAWIGATQGPGVTDSTPSGAARDLLETSARSLLAGRAFAVTGQRSGVRVNLPDKHPIAGRHPGNPRLGLMNGLGSKGALRAPALARQWVRHLMCGAAFEAEVATERRFGRQSAAAFVAP